MKTGKFKEKCSDFLKDYTLSAETCSEDKTICSTMEKPWCNSTTGSCVKMKPATSERNDDRGLFTYWVPANLSEQKVCVFVNHGLEDSAFFNATRTRFLRSHSNWPQNHYIEQVSRQLKYIDAETFFDKLKAMGTSGGWSTPSNEHVLNHELMEYTIETDTIGDLRILEDSHCVWPTVCWIDGAEIKLGPEGGACLTNPLAKVTKDGTRLFSDKVAELKNCYDREPIEIIPTDRR